MLTSLLILLNQKLCCSLTVNHFSSFEFVGLHPLSHNLLFRIKIELIIVIVSFFTHYLLEFSTCLTSLSILCHLFKQILWFSIDQ